VTIGQPFLREDERRQVRDLIGRVVPDAEVRVFGSRATGRLHLGSDLDLLFTRPARLPSAPWTDGPHDSPAPA
jgi:predicted nucleotidyltransferase